VATSSLPALGSTLAYPWSDRHAPTTLAGTADSSGEAAPALEARPTASTPSLDVLGDHRPTSEGGVMSTVPEDREIPDEVPAPDYLEQQALADPNDPEHASGEPSAGPGLDELVAGDGRVETDQLGLDAEADEADLLEQATSVPAEDGRADEEE
jgi:hypothetical protein